MKTPILGSSYVTRSVNAADSRMVNLFPELVPEGGKESAFLSRAPGLTLVASVGTGPVRGMIVMGGLLYVVSGSTLYSVDANYNIVTIGTVVNDGKPVSMATGPGLTTNNLFIACNGPSYLYSVDPVSGGLFGQIVDPAFKGAVTVGFLDGFFVWNQPNTQTIWVLDVLNIGNGINPLNFKQAEGSPDNVVGLIVDHRELWIFGTNSTEVWYDAGNPLYPFAPIQGAFSEIGCASPWTIAKMDNTVFWLSSDARGQGIVYKARGYTGQRISTHALEWQIQQYGDISNALAYTYQQDGHAFYVLVFPGHNTTWVYDAATQAWHERAGFSSGAFTRHAGNCQVFFNNFNLVGDYSNGNIYKFDLYNYTDNGAPQRWLRSWRALASGENKLTRAAHHSLQLDCESGVGLNAGQGSDPQVMLRWSDDGGHTWSNEHWASMGKIGEFYRRVIWRRLGMTLKLRDRVYEVSGTDPVKIIIMGAELNASGSNA